MTPIQIKSQVIVTEIQTTEYVWSSLCSLNVWQLNSKNLFSNGTKLRVLNSRKLWPFLPCPWKCTFHHYLVNNNFFVPFVSSSGQTSNNWNSSSEPLLTRSRKRSGAEHSRAVPVSGLGKLLSSISQLVMWCSVGDVGGPCEAEPGHSGTLLRLSPHWPSACTAMSLSMSPASLKLCDTDFLYS